MLGIWGEISLEYPVPAHISELIFAVMTVELCSTWFPISYTKVNKMNEFIDKYICHKEIMCCHEDFSSFKLWL